MAVSHPSEKLPVNFPNFAPKLRTIPSKMRGHAHAESNHEENKGHNNTISKQHSSTAAPSNHIAVDSWGKLCEQGRLSCITRAGLAGSAAGG
eukprot:scaffold134307_cov41-Cyclotella_meneghiniana.AAC.1